MNFDQVPAELRALRQWTVWRPVLRRQADGQTKVTKPPYRPDDPSIPADPHDPYTWGSFEDAVATYERHRSVLGGIGFMLTQADPYVVVDVDNKEKVPQGMEGYRQEFEKQLWALGTYTEHSPSDTGWHVWMRASMAVAGRHLQGVGSEVYAWQRFITVTGRPVSAGHAGVVLDCQDFIAMVGLGEAAPEMAVEDDAAKPCDLTDQEVLARAHAYVSHFSERWAGHAGCGPGEWSHTFVNVVGVLDRITGSVAQLQRLIFNAPMVVGQHVQPAGSGESRPAKARRTFTDVLSRVRHSNRGGSYFVSHGREVWQAIEAERDRRAQAEMRAQEAALARELAEAEEVGGYTKVADGMLSRFPQLTEEHRKLTVPPGLVGEFVRAADAASRAPFVKYTIPATLATLGGLVGRAYTPDTGGPLPLNYVLVGPSSTGKTQSMKVWHHFVGQANAALPINVQPRDRVLTNGTASIQGIMPDLMRVPSCVWFIEEASAQLNGMSNPKTTTEETLRTCYNEFYDCGEHGHSFQPPRSVASRNANIQAINKLCVSTYWTTTPNKFKIDNNDVLDGFASRVVFIRHTGPGGELVREVQPLPDHLRQALTTLLIQADNIDRMYEMNAVQAQAQAGRVDTSDVRDMAWEMTQICAGINRDALTEKLPETYTAVSRVPQSAMRMACVMAIVENPWTPRVTPAQYRWAFGYLLQNVAALLSAMDAGEIGDSASDDIKAAQRVIKAMMKKGKTKDKPGLARNELHKALVGQQPFRTHRDGRSQAVTRTLKLMLEEGYLEEVQGEASGRGRPPVYVRLRDIA